jgi:hypothetical protein
VWMAWRRGAHRGTVSPRHRAILVLPMPIPIQGPVSSDVPVRTIERDELRRKVRRYAGGIEDWESAGRPLDRGAA